MRKLIDPNKSLAPRIVEKLRADFFYKDVQEQKPDSASLRHLGFSKAKHLVFTEKAYGFTRNGIMLAQTSRIITDRNGNELLKTTYAVQEFNKDGKADGRYLQLKDLPEDHPRDPSRCMDTASLTFYQNGKFISQENSFDLELYRRAGVNMGRLEKDYNEKRDNPPAPTNSV